MSEITPNQCDGRNRSKGKKKPVTLVKTAVTRNNPVQSGNVREPGRPKATTNPAAKAIRLKSVCTNVSVDIPKIIAAALAVPARYTGHQDRVRRQGKYLRIFASSCRGL